MKWTKKTKGLAAVLGLCAGLALLAAYLIKESGQASWRHFLFPILFAAAVFTLAGSALHKLELYRRLKALPGADYPFGSLNTLTALEFYFLLAGCAAAFTLVLAPGSTLAGLLFSWQHIVFFMAAIFFVGGGGTNLLVTERQDGTVYRDSVSSSFFSRQDYFYSLFGDWDEGIIVGDKTFLYKEINSYEEEKKCLMVRGREEEAGRSYVLVLYTPRIIKGVLQDLREHKIPGR